MAAHNELGRKGEQMGAAWLVGHGYELLHQNWRYGRAEVDIIAAKETVLHFIEVKSRRSQQFGYPEERVGTKKIQNLLDAAEEYLYLFPQWKRIQYDILSITFAATGEVDFFLIEDVYL